MKQPKLPHISFSIEKQHKMFKRANSINTEDFNRQRGKGSQFQASGNKTIIKSETSIIQQIDNKIEMHRRDIESRNDMIIHIEQALVVLREDVAFEKSQNEQKTKSLSDCYQQIVSMEATIKKFNTQQKHILDCFRIKGLQKNLQNKGEEIKALNQLIIDQGQKEAQYKKELTELTKRQEDFKKDNELYKSQIKSLQNELLILEKQLTSTKQNSVDIAKKASEEQLRKELLIKQGEEQIKIIQQSEQDLTKQVQLLQKELNEFQIESSKITKGNDSNLLETIRKLKDEIINNAQTREKEIRGLRNNIQSSTTDNIKMKTQFQDQIQTLQQQTQKIEQILSEKQGLERQLGLLEAEIVKLQQQNNNLKLMSTPSQKQNTNFAQIEYGMQQLMKAEKEMVTNLKCSYCKGLIKQPVTIIPCGHSYCFDCKKGYGKDCSTCGPKVKIEAAYRNELLDDILNMLKLTQSSIAILKSIQE